MPLCILSEENEVGVAGIALLIPGRVGERGRESMKEEEMKEGRRKEKSEDSQEEGEGKMGRR